MSGINRWLAAILALVLLYLIRAILAPFAIAVVLAYIFVPGIDWLAARLRLRRVMIVAGIYVLLLASLALLFYALGPTLRDEVRLLRRDSVQVVQDALRQMFGGETIDVFGVPLSARAWAVEWVTQVRNFFNSPESALQFGSAVLTSAGEFVLTLIVLFYLLLDWEKLGGLAFRFVPVEARPRVADIANRIHQQLGRYIRGELVLIVFVSALTFVFLFFIFHVPFSLVLALSTGFLEIIPLIGPVTAGAAAALVAVSKGGPALAIEVIIFYFVLRQIEDWFIMPIIVGRAVQLHPAMTLFAALAGGALIGPLGLLLGVPAAAAIKVILDVTQPPVVNAEEQKKGDAGKAETTGDKERVARE